MQCTGLPTWRTRAGRLSLPERLERAVRDTFSDHDVRGTARVGVLSRPERRTLVGLLAKLADAQADWMHRRS